MNGVNLTLRALHHGERSLAKHLSAAAERHHTDHEVHHVARDLAVWSNDHCRRVAETGRHYGLDLGGPPEKSAPGLVSVLREKSAEAVGRRPEPGLLLLHDLRELHLAATGNSLYWEMLAQAGQAAKDDRLVELASFCHPRTLRQMRWTNTLIKTLSPQILTSV
ncbi:MULTISPECIES: hypothetical protein [unclassified Streptomyces]|uniref:hypothetical protein n=1 Tax=unclassified Streptomyces TaxID=2593676 RepID=UPI0004AA8ED8|nr:MULTISPECIES: hypothetical protein [unclassified Streptomyces]APU42652.1 hypothetical protein BSL84_25580 [Streptomyces sp. TN58]KJK45333.1 hypothetical protein UK14_26325 [Streptomyces sp. NRRL F-4428]